MTINEIAKKADVSVATVSRALNGNGPVRKETRQRIQQIARQNNYKPNPIARGLSKKRTDTIGVILPELVDEFFTDIIRGIDEEAHQSNLYLMVSSSHSQRDIVATILEFMSSGRVDGVILMAPKLHEEPTELISKSKRPLVLINSCHQSNNVVSFNINNYQGAFAVTDHLIKHGYQNIGMIKGPEYNYDAEQRSRGFIEAFDQHGLSVQDSLIIPGDFTVKSGYYGFMRLISQSKKPEAIFAANDMMAVGAYEAAKSANIMIPQDIAIAGFDDIYLSRLLTPRLTTVHVPIVELGKKAMKYLLKMINGEIDPLVSYREMLSTGLVIGGSCGCNTSVTQTLL